MYKNCVLQLTSFFSGVELRSILTPFVVIRDRSFCTINKEIENREMSMYPYFFLS